MLKSLNRTYTISKENSANGGTTLERQKWDKQHNMMSNVGLNSPNYNSNERKHLKNESNETPTWVENLSEKP